MRTAPGKAGSRWYQTPTRPHAVERIDCRDRDHERSKLWLGVLTPVMRPREFLTTGARTTPLRSLADRLPDARQRRIALGVTCPHGTTVARWLTGRTGAIARPSAHTGEYAGATPAAPP
jgi:hypothetical protein